MSNGFDDFVYGATLPFHAAKEISLFAVSAPLALMTESVETMLDSDHEFAFSRTNEEYRNVVNKVAGVGIGIGAILASGGTAGLVMASAAMCNSASNINEKLKLISDGCSDTEEALLRVGMAVDTCNFIGTSATVGMNGFDFSANILEPLKLASAAIGVPINVCLKVTSDIHAETKNLPTEDKAIKAAELGLSLFKFEQLLQELDAVYS